MLMKWSILGITVHFNLVDDDEIQSKTVEY